MQQSRLLVYTGAVAVSGETDLVTDGKTLVFSQGGSSLMSRLQVLAVRRAAFWRCMRV